MSAAKLALVAAAAGTALVTLLVVTAALAIAPEQSPDASISALPGQVGDIPPEYLTHYAKAGDDYDIDWAILAAIGKIETNHGRSTLPGVRSGVNSYGCCAGPMQFYVIGPNSTWQAFGVDGNKDGRTNVHDPADAIPTAARYLVAGGAPRNYRRAIYSYNHAWWYVDDVLEQAARYRAMIQTPAPGASTWHVLSNPRITLSPSQRSDVANGRIDPRVIGALSWAATRHTIYVSSLKSDHSVTTSSGKISNHSLGRALDIALVDNQPCTGSRHGACGQLAVEFARLTGRLRSTELIYCFDPDGSRSGDAFAAGDHCDHIHLGYRTNP